MFPVYILAVIFTGIIGITWVDNYMKLKKEQIKASSKGANPKLEQEVEALIRQNRDLQRRIENLEAIVVDADLKVDTGINSRMDTLQDDVRSRGRESDLEI